MFITLSGYEKVLGAKMDDEHFLYETTRVDHRRLTISQCRVDHGKLLPPPVDSRCKISKDPLLRIDQVILNLVVQVEPLLGCELASLATCKQAAFYDQEIFVPYISHLSPPPFVPD